jgi:hypothetical protein
MTLFGALRSVLYLAGEVCEAMCQPWHAPADRMWEDACRARSDAHHLAEQTELLRDIRNILQQGVEPPRGGSLPFNDGFPYSLFPNGLAATTSAAPVPSACADAAAESPATDFHHGAGQPTWRPTGCTCEFPLISTADLRATHHAYCQYFVAAKE